MLKEIVGAHTHTFGVVSNVRIEMETMGFHFLRNKSFWSSIIYIENTN